MALPDTGALTNMAGTEWTTGKVGGALQFDGSEDHVLVNASSDFYYDAGVSFAAWCKADVVGVLSTIMAQDLPTSQYLNLVLWGTQLRWDVGDGQNV